MSSNEVAVTDPPDTEVSDQQQGGDEPPDPQDVASDASEQEVSEEQAEPLSLDVIFEVLKNQRRRLVLKYLKAQEDTVALGELAEHVAAQENGKSVEAITSDERKRVYVGLYQCHLPKMDDMEIVEFNRNRGLVDLTDTASQLDEYLEQGETTTSRQWYRYYGAIALVGLALSGAVAVGVAPVASAPTVALAAVVGAFGVVALAHAWTAHDNEDD